MITCDLKTSQGFPGRQPWEERCQGLQLRQADQIIVSTLLSSLHLRHRKLLPCLRFLPLSRHTSSRRFIIKAFSYQHRNWCFGFFFLNFLHRAYKVLSERDEIIWVVSQIHSATSCPRPSAQQESPPGLRWAEAHHPTRPPPNASIPSKGKSRCFYVTVMSF